MVLWNEYLRAVLICVDELIAVNRFVSGNFLGAAVVIGR